MGISPLGEAYANYGSAGGIWFMTVFGALFAVVYLAVLNFTARHPSFIFWVPLMFYQAIKAETELLVVINQLSKGAIVAFGCYFLTTQVFPLRRSPSLLLTDRSPEALPQRSQEA